MQNEQQTQQAQISNEEVKFKHFILANIDKFDSIQDKNQKAHEIVATIRHYFTEIYNPSTEVEFEEAKKSQG